MKKTVLLLALLITCTLFTHAQNWARDMRDPSVNFFTVQREFNAWWAINGQAILSGENIGGGEKGELWKIYKRWEHDMWPRMVATAGVRLGAPDAGEKNFYQQERARQNQRSGSTWSYIGPALEFNDGEGDSSAGRVNCVRFDPVNHNTIYCGAPSGGLWKSTNFGSSWQLLNTDNLPQIGVSDIVINPQNTNTIYIATGDIANSACISVGVYKSTDGGQTWDTTGLNWTISQGMLIARLLMSPLDSNTMFAATNTGVFKTLDGGITWSMVRPEHNLIGMEFNPLNPNTIYTWGTQLYKTVDAGATWNKLTVGLPDSLSSGGFAIGLTPADTSCVYVLVSDSIISGESYFPYKGFYRSLNGGTSFTLQAVPPDATGTQGTYDLNVGVSPVNRDVIVIAAVNSMFSSNGGVNWTAAGFASHVDHHDIRFFNGSGDTVFSADDGGLFISTDTGDTWQGLNNGMHIGQIYNICSGGHTPYLYISGRQDEGTMMQDTSYDFIASGGDGLECYIDPLNEQHIFGSIEDGIIGTSYTGGHNIAVIAFNFAGGVNGPGVWNTPYVVQRNNADIIYIGKDLIYKSTNGGTTFTSLHTPALHANDNLFQLMAISPVDSNYIYAATYYSLYRSTDGGDTFTNVTGSLSGGYFSTLAVSESNPKEIWVGYAGHSAELLHSVNAGTSFAAFGTGLPGTSPFYPLSIAPVRDSKNALYCSLANAGGVYYRDSTMTSWIPFGSGLPNVSVDQLEIDYCVNKIRAGTYGRDIWETAPYQPLSVPPIANATYQVSPAACTDTVSFTDASDYAPTAWQWYFPGGQPVSSTNENPVVIYPDGSQYTATFIASSANGADTVQYSIQTNYCTGIKQLSADKLFALYPNPADDYTMIDFDATYTGSTVMVEDITGKELFETKLTASPQQIYTGNLPAGVYLVALYNNGQIGARLLVKE